MKCSNSVSWYLLLVIGSLIATGTAIASEEGEPNPESLVENKAWKNHLTLSALPVYTVSHGGSCLWRVLPLEGPGEIAG